MPREFVEPENLLGYDGRRSESSGVSPRGFGSAYQGAVEATLAVVISVLIGVWADTKLDSSPAFFLVGLAVGFGAFILRLTRLLREAGRPDGESGERSESGNSGKSESSESKSTESKTAGDTPPADDRRDTDP